MPDSVAETILLVCGCEQGSIDALDRLHAGGFRVIGPAPNAATALTLAAQMAPTLAVFAGEPTGRRDAHTLAGELMYQWGIKSMLLDAPEIESPDAPWKAGAERTARIRRALMPEATHAA